MNSDYDPLQGYVEEPSSDPRFRVFRRPNDRMPRALQACLFLTILGIIVTVLVLATTLTLSDPVGSRMVILDESPGLRQILRMSYPISGTWESPEKVQRDTSSETWKKMAKKGDAVSESIKYARNSLDGRRLLEDRILQESSNTEKENNPSLNHQRATAWTPDVTNITNNALVLEEATSELVKKGAITKEDVRAGSALPEGIISNITSCKEPIVPVCDLSAGYRKPDGSCNNLKYPLWGSSKRTFRRALPAHYDDGIFKARLVGREMTPLPSARGISVGLATAGELRTRTLTNLTHMFLTWGQFLDHDITATAPTKGVNGEGILCCNRLESHPECLPISIPKGDNVMESNEVDCMEFIRSSPALTCSIGPREQMNLITSYIDASNVYHSDRLEARWLRTMYRGYLRGRMSPDGRGLLPISPDPEDGCNRPEEVKNSRYCFKAGDVRVNEQPTLTSMHILWMREHNRISNTLFDINPTWPDEKLYQEARKIVVAQIQHITYKEFLPILLGDNVVDYLELRPQVKGYFLGYNEEVDATVSNEFATAAYRFGHSMLQGLVQLQGPAGRNVDFVQLHKLLFNPFQHWDPGHLDSLMRGQASQNPRPVSISFNEQVRNHLFESRQGHVGLDLLAINIQRGRDHGLQSYVHWRVLCGLTNATSFDGLRDEIVAENIELLKGLYGHVSDVDLYVGIVSETPIEGGLVGPTAACLLADQFLRLRNGDRYWYETPDRNLRFTAGQLNEIRKTSLSRIICDNADAMDYLQLEVFRPVSGVNPLLSCNSNLLPRINLNEWDDDESDFLLPLFAPSSEEGATFATKVPRPKLEDPEISTGTRKTTIGPALKEVFELLNESPESNVSESALN